MKQNGGMVVQWVAWLWIHPDPEQDKEVADDQ